MTDASNISRIIEATLNEYLLLESKSSKRSNKNRSTWCRPALVGAALGALVGKSVSSVAHGALAGIAFSNPNRLLINSGATKKKLSTKTTSTRRKKKS